MPVDRRGALLVYVLCALVVLALGWRWIAARERAATPVAPEAVAGAAVLERRAPRPVVHVAGAVLRPGVYRLRAGARVRDALSAAGGPRRGADTAGVNLAARVADGQQVLVPARGPASDIGGERGGPLSLSSATVEQLDGLAGVGPATADKIVAWRTDHGGFSSVEQLAEIPGIGPKRLEALRGLVAP